MSGLNAHHRRHLLQAFSSIHEVFVEMESLMAQSACASAFGRYEGDMAPTEKRIVEDHFARIRAAMQGHLRELDIPLEVRQTSLRWAIQGRLTRLGVVIDGLGPRDLSGYGPVDAEGRKALVAIQDDLSRLLEQLRGFIQGRVDQDLAGRLARLEVDPADKTTLETMERIVSRWGLVEFRSRLDMLVRRYEGPQYEIAVFGRVSSGKSSLLNHLTGFGVLPVGVTPVTAVPTRLAHGAPPHAVVTFAEAGPRSIPVAQIGDFASEEGNPANSRHVTDILVRLPSVRLREGVVFVDTPGVGSLAREGAAEAMAYLPRCDLGVVLIDAGSTLHQDDLVLLQALASSGTTAMVLLSKADLLSANDRERAIAYTRRQLLAELKQDFPVHPVSTVGTDEALLTRWFESEVVPLLERHQELMTASLGRKTEDLRTAINAALELLSRRGQRAASSGETEQERHSLKPRLDRADVAIRRARDQGLAWSDERRNLCWIAAQWAARRVVETKRTTSGTDENPTVDALREVISQRGRMARERVFALHAELVAALEGALLPGADASGLREMRLPGLPVPDVDAADFSASHRCPWWAALARRWAQRVLEQRFLERHGAAMQDVINREDRRLQEWYRAAVNSVVAEFESVGAAVREQVRRPADAVDGPGSHFDFEQLEQDLRELRQEGDLPSFGGPAIPRTGTSSTSLATDQTRKSPT